MYLMDVDTTHDNSNSSDVENVETESVDRTETNSISNHIKIETNIDDQKSSVKSTDSNILNHSKNWTMATVQVGYDITRKGERSLVVDGFKFTKSRDGTNSRVFWRCSRRECKATAVTVNDRVEHVRSIHAHDPPLNAEFFSGNECNANSNTWQQKSELQEVRFNTSPANIRSASRCGRRRSSSKTQEELSEDIDNKSNFEANLPNITLEMAVDLQNPTKPILNHYPLNNSVKEQVREFILRNSSQSLIQYPNNKVEITQFLISQQQQQHQQQHQQNQQQQQQQNQQQQNQQQQHQQHQQQIKSEMYNTALTNNNNLPSNLNYLKPQFNDQHFNFTTVHHSPNHLSDSTSEPTSHKSVTPNNINNHSEVTSASIPPATNQQQLENLLTMLLHNNSTTSNTSLPRQRNALSTTISDCDSPATIPMTQTNQNNSPASNYNHASSPPYHANRQLHWKKEKILESSLDKFECSRKRKLIAEVENPSSVSSAVNYYHKFLDSYRPAITAKLIAVVEKLGAELSPEMAVAQEVYEKCTAIKTCLETLEKLNSLSSVAL